MYEDDITKVKDGCKSRCCRCGKKVTVGVLTPLGILLAVAAAFFPKIYTDTLKKQLVLIKGSEAYTNWLSPPSPVYMKYYVFNYTNVKAILSHHEKPNVSQVGPFVYREIRINKVLDYNEHNITYIQNYSYVFEPHLSCPTCSEDGMVYVPSISGLTVIKGLHDKLKQPGGMVEFFVNLAMNVASVKLFKELTIRQVIWGYKDTLLENLEKYIKDYGKMLEPILKKVGFKLPKLNPIIALQHNGTEGADEIGNVTLLTGKDNIDDVQKIVRWRGLDNAPYWLTKYGRMINGTDGTHAPPFLKRDYKWYVFVTQLCRSLYFTYEKDVTFQKIHLYRFTTTAELFMNASVNHDNRAFCSDNETCWGSGLLCISKCQAGGPPIFMSAPHFYDGDPKFAERINGLKPNKTLHATIADVEPTTGITMRAYKRLQINVMAQKSWLSITKPLQHDANFLPLLMIEEGAVIDPETAAKFQKMVLLPKSLLVSYGRYVIMAAGATMVLSALILLFMMISDHYKSSYNSEEKSVQKMSSDGNVDLNVKIRKIDSTVTIISNDYCVQ